RPRSSPARLDESQPQPLTRQRRAASFQDDAGGDLELPASWRAPGEWSPRRRSRMLDGLGRSCAAGPCPRFDSSRARQHGDTSIVTARLLMVVFDAVYLIALTAWIGSILFFSFGVAPIIFKVLGTEMGGRFVRALFPRYYTWGVISGAVALPAAVGVP